MKNVSRHRHSETTFLREVAHLRIFHFANKYEVDLQRRD